MILRNALDWSLKQWAIVLFVITLASRCALLIAVHYQPQIANDEVERIARNLAAQNLFGNPYSIPTGPTGHCAPAYPFLLSLIIRTAGTGTTSALIAVAINLFFAGLQYALLPLLAQVLCLPRLIGIGAGLIGATLPFRGLSEVKYETPINACALVVLFILTILVMRKAKPGWGRVAGLGIAWGLCCLITPVLLMVALTLWGLWSLFARPPAREWLTVSALFFAAFVLAVLPWTIRNYYSLGGFAFVRDNIGLELAVSNHDGAYPTVEENYSSGVYWQVHPYDNAKEARRVLELGELRYNREKLQQAKEWITTHPARFATLVTARFFAFWVVAGKQRGKQLFLAFVTLIGLVGLLQSARRHHPAALLFAAAWIGYPAIYYLVEVEARYHYPLDWTSFFLAGVAIHSWWGPRSEVNALTPEHSTAMANQVTEIKYELRRN